MCVLRIFSFCVDIRYNKVCCEVGLVHEACKCGTYLRYAAEKVVRCLYKSRRLQALQTLQTLQTLQAL